MRSNNFSHINWLLQDFSQTLTLSTGEIIDVWTFKHEEDEEILSGWAKHFRNHYCDDSEIDDMRDGENLSRKEYLISTKFPDKSKRPGPSIRAGDFSEILVADYLEKILNYQVPRTRYDRKTIQNESTKGSDVIALKVVKNPDNPTHDDELIIFEVKSNYRGSKPDTEAKLQNAIDHSAKDKERLGESLNAMKQRLRDKNERDAAELVTRFQNIEDRPFKLMYGAAAIFSSHLYNPSKLNQIDTTQHVDHKNLKLLIIHGEQMMELVHHIYRRAADEA